MVTHTTGTPRTTSDIALKVWGDMACFTRAEMPSERMSYPVPTPSAMRGLLSSIFWKPEINWQILQIDIIKPGRYLSLVRNEVKNKIALRSVQEWMERTSGRQARSTKRNELEGHYTDESEEGHTPYFTGEDHTPRMTSMLCDVEYVVHARLTVHPNAGAPSTKYWQQFLRRVERGQFYSAPYLGIREFAAFFAAPSGQEQPVNWTEDLGWMLYDFEFPESVRPGKGLGPGEEGEGPAIPRFFEARVENGIIRIPPPPSRLNRTRTPQGRSGRDLVQIGGDTFIDKNTGEILDTSDGFSDDAAPGKGV